MAAVGVLQGALTDLDEGRPGEAVKKLTAAEVAPGDPRFAVWCRLVMRSFGKGSPEEQAAAERLAQGIATSADDPDLLTDAGEFLRAGKKYDWARRAFQRALDRQPTNETARYLLGIALYGEKQFPTAVAVLKVVPPTAPEYEQAASIAGAIVFDSMGDWNAGYQMMAAAANGRNVSNWANLAEAALATKRFLEAQLISRRVLAARDVDPADAYVALAMRFVLVSALVQSGDFSAALQELEALVTAVTTVQSQEWSYKGSRGAASRIESPAQRRFVQRLIDYVETLGKTGDSDELRSLLERASRASGP